MKYYQFRKRHIFCMEDVGLEEDLNRSFRRFNLQTKEWMSWVEIPMTLTVYDRVMRTMQFGSRATDEIEERLWNSGRAETESPPSISLWAFYNVLTWYITLRITSLNRRVEMENG